jgi:hypothetical protein
MRHLRIVFGKYSSSVNSSGRGTEGRTVHYCRRGMDGAMIAKSSVAQIIWIFLIHKARSAGRYARRYARHRVTLGQTGM